MALDKDLPEPNNAEELVTLIREFLPFLFDSHGFRVADAQDTESESHLVVLTSEVGSLRFLCRRWERGSKIQTLPGFLVWLTMHPMDWMPALSTTKAGCLQASCPLAVIPSGT